MAVSQRFGEKSNVDYYKKNGVNVIGHNGIDLIADHGTPIYAAHDGMAYYQVDEKGGHGVVITSNIAYDFDDGAHFIKTIYWHMCDPLKEPQFKSPIADKPKQVKRGELIGYADNTGLSTGDHLHFALKVGSMDSSGNFINLYQNNGYFGCIDPSMYLTATSKIYFTDDLHFGDNNELVAELQRRLGVKATGYYGPLTQKAVFAFQQKYVNMSWWERNVAKGYTCGPKTREALDNFT